MKILGMFFVVLALMLMAGCRTSGDAVQIQPVKTEAAAAPVATRKCVRRLRNEKQLDVLRTFALQESQSLWQTLQTLNAEIVSRKAGLKGLRNDLLEFGRNPDTDKDFQVLKASVEDLEASLESVYCKLEDAYLAYKKYQATPGKREYNDIMRRALEDGIQEADSASRRYRSMTINK